MPSGRDFPPCNGWSARSTSRAAGTVVGSFRQRPAFRAEQVPCRSLPDDPAPAQLTDRGQTSVDP